MHSSSLQTLFIEPRSLCVCLCAHSTNYKEMDYLWEFQNKFYFFYLNMERNLEFSRAINHVFFLSCHHGWLYSSKKISPLFVLDLFSLESDGCRRRRWGGKRMCEWSQRPQKINSRHRLMATWLCGEQCRPNHIR